MAAKEALSMYLGWEKGVRVPERGELEYLGEGVRVPEMRERN